MFLPCFDANRPRLRGCRLSVVAFRCALLLFLTRLGWAFDPSEPGRKPSAATKSKLQIDSFSAAALIVICVFCTVGRKELPFASEFPQQGGGKPSRFRILGLRPSGGCQRPRSCTLYRVLFFVQGAILLIWFALPHELTSQQSLSGASSRAQTSQYGLLYAAAVWLWGVVVSLFEHIDGAAAACVAQLAPPMPWVFSLPSWLLEGLHERLLVGKDVGLLPLLSVVLPWLIYGTTVAMWLRLSLVLCRMKKSENDTSMHQLRQAVAESAVVETELSNCSEAEGSAARSGNAKSKMRPLLSFWRLEVWEYFSFYFFLAALCPLAMYLLLLGRAQAWPLFLCCMKWRLLLFLSRILVVSPPQMRGKKSGCISCNCCSCKARVAVANVGTPDEVAMGPEGKLPSQSVQSFLLSENSVCMLAGLLTLDTFFTTGHRMKISALPIQAGFIGLLDFHPVLSFVTSFLHMFLVYMISCPLIFMVGFLRLAQIATKDGIEETKEMEESSQEAVVQKTLLGSGKLAFR